MLKLLAVLTFLALPSTDSRIDYTGDGVVTQFFFNFKTASASHVEVYVGGVKVTSGVKVALNANQDSAPGGSVTFTTAPAAASLVRLQRTVPLKQETVWQPLSAFKAKTLEGQLDRLVMQDQQLQREVDDAGDMLTSTVADLAALRTADISNQAAKDALQDAALAAGAVGGSATVVQPSGAYTGRALSSWTGDVINVKAEGAVGDGVVDDTAAIQRAINRLSASWSGSTPRRVFFPNGTYRVTSEITIASKIMFELEGPGAGIVWDTNDVTKSIFHVTGFNSRSAVRGLSFSTTAGKKALAAITFEGGGGNGEVFIERVNVYGNASLDFEYGLLTTGTDANNDHYKIIGCHIDYVRLACVRFGHTQSKAHVLIGNRFQSFSSKGVGVSSAGSYYWWGGATGSNMTDFLQTSISGVDAIYIGGVNSEGSKRFFGPPLWTTWETATAYSAGYSIVKASNGFLYYAATTGTSGATEPTHLAGTVSDGGVSWTYAGTSINMTGPASDANPFPLTIEHVRFGSYAVELDGIESLDGSDNYLKPGATAAECDPTVNGHTTAGWAAIINYASSGPLNLRNNQFQPASGDPRARRLKVRLGGSINGMQATIVGNLFTGTNVKAPPIVPWYQTSLTYPSQSNPNVELSNNIMWIDYGGVDYGESYTTGFPRFHSRPVAGGRPYILKTGGGATLTIADGYDHVRAYLSMVSLNTINLPNGQNGQIMTIDFVQHSAMHAVIPQSAWPATKVVFTQGPFVAPYAYNSHASITFRWDPMGYFTGSAFTGAWVEVARSNAGPVIVGSGTPEGAVQASPGTLYVRTDGSGATLMYRKATGTDTNTGWVAAGISQATAQADSVAADVATLKTDFNALLAKLRTAGVLAP